MKKIISLMLFPNKSDFRISNRKNKESKFHLKNFHFFKNGFVKHEIKVTMALVDLMIYDMKLKL